MEQKEGHITKKRVKPGTRGFAKKAEVHNELRWVRNAPKNACFFQKEKKTLAGQHWISKQTKREEQLINFNEFSSTGPHELHLTVLKEEEKVIANLLTVIFEKSWRIGEFLENWRESIHRHDFKKGEGEKPRKL